MNYQIKKSRIIDLNINLILPFSSIFLIVFLPLQGINEIIFEFVSPLKNIAFFLMLSSSILVFFKYKTYFNKLALFSISLLTFYILYGLISSYLYLNGYGFDLLFTTQGINQNTPPIFFLLISLPFTLWLSMGVKEEKEWINFARLLTFSGILSVFIFISTGTFNFDVMDFNYSQVRSLVAAVDYSQQISLFFSFLATASTFCFFYDNNIKNKIFMKLIYFLLTLVYLPFSFLGGGRGDFIVGVVIVSIIFIKNLLTPKKNHLIKNISTLFLASSLIILISYWISFLQEDNSALSRYLTVLNTGTWGTRDVLISLSFKQITNSHCALTGCGFAAFQAYNSFKFGDYPHNSLLEMVISFGIFFGFIPYCLAILKTTIHFISSRIIDFRYIISTFFILISLKSIPVTDTIFFPSLIFLILNNPIKGYINLKN